MPSQPFLDRLTLGAGLLLAWELASRWFGAYWVTPPWATLEQLVVMIREGGLLRHTGYTLLAATLGFALGAVPGALLPLWMRRHPRLLRVLDPFLAAGYGLPSRDLGTVSVMGPLRMDYARAISSVRAAANELSRFVQDVYES